jgi:hypothetical protein
VGPVLDRVEAGEPVGSITQDYGLGVDAIELVVARGRPASRAGASRRSGAVSVAEGGGFEPPRDVTPNTDSSSTTGVSASPAESQEIPSEQGKRGPLVHRRCGP